MYKASQVDNLAKILTNIFNLDLHAPCYQAPSIWMYECSNCQRQCVRGLRKGRIGAAFPEDSFIHE